ncbi:anti-anti-sigma factor [Krasilnikovia cinnamomea]|uniref:Anti-sigma factor antagonist n=1 Tax=Krasilnikovia cinnamomea TaxID=349313 RepID=A0A4Q7ZEJ5_9ACTN|nr:STAS domain-containing protein [Krasilnikovia cinnamomea]RZU48704.1 anti-anti-sigma factor [Krasilnikovia cinnamomea]
MTFPPAAPAPPLLVEVEAPTSAATVVTITGEIDMVSESQVCTVVTDVLRRSRPHRLVLDMSDVTFLDSSGVRALIQCRDRAEQLGARLEIHPAHEIVRQVLSICGIADLFLLQEQ